MAVLVSNMNGHLQTHLTRSLERILEEANQSGELRLSNRKLKDFPKSNEKYNLGDTVIADLSKNRFSELPEEVTGFYFLEKLQCYHNAMRFIPDAISNLQCLNFLDLSRNQLTSLPREICQLPIQILLVSNNRLKSLPDELSRMSTLTELDASCNQLTHLPAHMGDLQSLQSLVLRQNQLLAVPVDITLLPELARLDLRANRIGALPLELRYMNHLQDLLIEDNPLTVPPASLCKRGRVHIFKYLENEAVRVDGVRGSNVGTLGRRSRKNNAGSGSPGPPHHLPDRLKTKRQNVDSGYSTSSDDKRWSQEIAGDIEKQWNSTPKNGRIDLNGTSSTLSTPSTISPFSADTTLEDSASKKDGRDSKDSSVRVSPISDSVNFTNGDGIDDKTKSLSKIQTYREYKEALKQQRALEVTSVYRPRDSGDDSQGYKTEPSTPLNGSPAHHPTLASSQSDPTPLNTLLSSTTLTTKSIYDDTRNIKKPVQKVQPSRGQAIYSPTNGNKYEANGHHSVQDYVKPRSPMKTTTGILSHDNVPHTNGNTPKATHSPKNVNGVGNKTPRNISWNPETAKDKLSFTMRREIDKAREETDLINKLRLIIESRLKMSLPGDFATSLADGVVLCHLANYIKPRSVASIHVPSPAVPKLTMARCRRNVDNFIDACRKIGVDENLVCCASDVLEGKGLVQVAITVIELISFHSPRSPVHTSMSTVC